MAIPVPQGGNGGTPFAKVLRIGDQLVGAFAGSANRQKRKFGDSKTLLYKSDGTTPLLEEVIHFIAMPGTTAVTGNVEKEETKPITPGEHVRFSVSGFKWGQVIDARKSLPAFAGFAAGQTCSSDVYTFKLVGYSAATENPAGAQAAGLTVVDGRIVMATEDEHEKWVLNQVRKNASANAAHEFEVTIRRIDQAAEKKWEQLADELYLTKPWERTESADGSTPEYAPAGPHPADARVPEDEPF